MNDHRDMVVVVAFGAIGLGSIVALAVLQGLGHDPSPIFGQIATGSVAALGVIYRDQGRSRLSE